MEIFSIMVAAIGFVVAVLFAGVAVYEWLLWRKGKLADIRKLENEAHLYAVLSEVADAFLWVDADE